MPTRYLFSGCGFGFLLTPRNHINIKLHDEVKTVETWTLVANKKQTKSRPCAVSKKGFVIVLIIKAILFVVEAAAGLLVNSTALLADSLDMLEDSLVYGFSLYDLWRSAAWKAKAALLKGAIMAVFGAGVLFEVVYKTISGIVPNAATMGIIGALVCSVKESASCYAFATDRMT